MTTQAQNDKMFFEKLFGKIRLLSLVMTITVVIKVPNSGEPFFIKIDLERSDLTLKRYLKLFKKSSNWMLNSQLNRSLSISILYKVNFCLL